MRYYWNAFKSGLNLGFLGIGLLAGMFLPAIPFFWAALLGAEALLVTSIGSSKGFRKMTDARAAREEAALLIARQRNAIRISGQSARNRLKNFDVTVRQIRQNFRQKGKSTTTSSMIENSLNSLQKLEIEFVRYLYNLVKLEDLNKKNSSNSNDLESRYQELQNRIAGSSGAIKDILEKQAEIIQKRMNNSSLNSESTGILKAQLETIEETLNYLLDESVQIYDPARVTNQVDQVLTSMETTRDTLKEIESFVEFSDPLMFSEKVH